MGMCVCRLVSLLIKLLLRIQCSYLFIHELETKVWVIWKRNMNCFVYKCAYLHINIKTCSFQWVKGDLRKRNNAQNFIQKIRQFNAIWRKLPKMDQKQPTISRGHCNNRKTLGAKYRDTCVLLRDVLDVR